MPLGPWESRTLGGKERGMEGVREIGRDGKREGKGREKGREGKREGKGMICNLFEKKNPFHIDIFT